MSKRFDNLFSALVFAAAVAVIAAGAFCLTHSINRARTEQPPVIVRVAPVHLAPPSPEPAVPMPEPTQTPEPQWPYNPEIPLTAELQAALYAACEEHDVPVSLALGLIQAESCFDVDAVSDRGCYGLMQLNPRYFPADLPTVDNLWAGIAWLSCLLEQYEDTGAALTAYNSGYDTGNRAFAWAVMAEAEYWEN